MWIYILVIFILLLAIAGYIYGAFSPVQIYKDKLIAPHLIYYSWKGKMNDISGEFERLKKDCESYFKLSSFFGIYYSQPTEELW